LHHEPSCLRAFHARVVFCDTVRRGLRQAIYAAYGPEGRTADLEDKYFSPDLLTLYDNVAKGAGDNVELAVDFDVSLNAQDIDQVTNLQTTVQAASDARQVIDVTFTAFGQETIMRYVFVAGADGWKIDDISWGEEGAALRPMLEELLRAQKDAG